MAVKARAEITLTSIRDVQSVTRYYLLQSSTSTAPAKPTTNPPGGSWVTKEPTYTTGSTNSLYFTDLTVFSDDSFVYSDVSLSSSYEAAKVAYNKAENAESIAEKATHSINLTPFGSRRFDDTKYWKNGFFTGTSGGVVYSAEQLEDGWIHVTVDPTGYTGTKAYVDDPVKVAASPSVKAGGLYTILYEVRNNKSTIASKSAYSYFYIQQANGHQFWGQSIVESLEGKASALLYLKDATTTNGVYRHRFTQRADSGTHAGSNPATLFQMVFRVDVRDVLDYEVRVSLYEDRYLGDYMPYVVSDITGLEADIAAAQTTANGKNTVYYQASAPSGGTYKTNDIWFDTGNGNKMYMWNGSVWTPEQFGNAAISDLSITNAKIANGTIESAKISNLDAGKITTGTMSAARIKGGEFSLGGENDTDGVMKVYNADGDLVGSFTKEGLEVIAGQIGGWGIFSQVLKNEWDLNLAHYRALLSPKEGLWLDETSLDQGMDPNGVYLDKVEYGLPGIIFTLRREINDAVKTGSSYIRGAFYDLDNEKGGIALGPHLIVENGGVNDPSSIDVDELYLKTLVDGSYIRQPAMIMSGVKTVGVSEGTATKSLALCTVPEVYQSGYRIVPFVSRRYSSASGVPSDNGDFYYAYYNSISHDVCIKLANKLPTGVIYQFDYMIYAVPET